MIGPPTIVPSVPPCWEPSLAPPGDPLTLSLAVVKTRSPVTNLLNAGVPYETGAGVGTVTGEGAVGLGIGLRITVVEEGGIGVVVDVIDAGLGGDDGVEVANSM